MIILRKRSHVYRLYLFSTPEMWKPREGQIVEVTAKNVVYNKNAEYIRPSVSSDPLHLYQGSDRTRALVEGARNTRMYHPTIVPII